LRPAAYTNAVGVIVAAAATTIDTGIDTVRSMVI
jgi:hypothetical protein